MNDELGDKEYLVGDFAEADIMLGHACIMNKRLGCVSEDMTALLGYLPAGTPTRLGSKL